MTGAEESPLVELRHYRLRDAEALEYFDRRSKAVTFPLFEKYGIRVKRFWVDVESPLDIHYLVGWNSEEEMQQTWARLRADPLWAEMVGAPDYVAPVETAESHLLRPAVDHSPSTAV